MKLNLNTEQRQVLSPKMEQSLRILQMDNLELEEYIQRVSEENPVVELSCQGSDEQRGEALYRRLERIACEDDRCAAGGSGAYDEDATDPLERLRAPEDCMRDLLARQVGVLRIPEEDARTALYLINCLDDNGYLTLSPEELARETGWTPERIQAGLDVLRGLEPAGVGAASLRECLLLQLERKGLLTGLMRDIVEHYLPQLGQGHFRQIASRLGQSPEVIKGCYRLIRELNPKPCASLGGERTTRYIVPDVTVVKRGGAFEVALNDPVSPRMIIRRDYLAMLGDAPDAATVRYIEDKLNQADWVAEAIRRRNRTLLSVGRAVVDRQLEFFQKGPKYLRPMTLSDVAAGVGLHPSTISRVANSKYLWCSQGVFPVRAFFTQGVEGTSAGDTRSSTSIKKLIGEWIAAENPEHPLSDQALVRLLQREGADISRRTVAKYREQLGIGSSAVRRALTGSGERS